MNAQHRSSCIITIDGPAGAGKTTVSKSLAAALGYRYIDTGALYRGVAVAALEAGIDAEDETALATLVSRIQLDFVESETGLRLLLDQRDITDRIRMPRISMLASAVSARRVVRRYLMDIQRAMGAHRNAVFEGRDMGTVVFPEADYKFFLDADPHIRANRRYKELSQTATQAESLERVEEEMKLRDLNDSTRRIAPLMPAPDAIRIDSSQLSIPQVVALMLEHIRKH